MEPESGEDNVTALEVQVNALRADMNDGFKRVDGAFRKVDNGFTEMRAKFDLAAAGQQQIVGLIQGLIDDRGGDPR